MHGFGMAEGQKTFFAVIMSDAGWADAAKWQIVLTNMHKRIVNADAAGMNLFPAALL